MTVDSSEGEESGFEKQFCVLKLITGPIFYFLNKEPPAIICTARLYFPKKRWGCARQAFPVSICCVRERILLFV